MAAEPTVAQLRRAGRTQAACAAPFRDSLGARNTDTLLRLRRQLFLRLLAGDNIPQREPAWYARRAVLIGGSHAGGLVPKETYKNMFKNFEKTVTGIRAAAQQLNQNRVGEMCRQRAIANGDLPASGWWSVPTTWGTVLETYAEELVARCVPAAPADVALVTCGSLRGAVPHTAFSPDGVGGVDWAFWSQFTAAAERAGDAYHPSRRDVRVVLLEYKNPYSAPPPDAPQWAYEAQVRAGLDAIPLAAAGLLLQLVWRRAPVYSLGVPREFNAGNGWYPHKYPPHAPNDDDRPAATCCPDLATASTEPYGYACILFRRVPGALLHPDTSRTPLQGAFSDEEFLSKAEQRRMTKQCLAAIRSAADDHPVKIPRELVGARGRLRDALTGDVCDVGASSHGLFAEVLFLWKQNVLAADYLPVRLYAHGEDRLGSLAAGAEYGVIPPAPPGAVVAVLPVKLFQVRAHQIERDGVGAPFAADMAPRAALARVGADVLGEGGTVEDAERAIWRGVERLRREKRREEADVGAFITGPVRA